MTLHPHPYADKFPMLGDAEHAELVESIRAHGLRTPIVLEKGGRILDGRNRARACEEIGIEPETVTYDGDDLAEYVIDCNVTRRNMSTGARAAATALVLAEDGRRENGRWRRGSVVNPESGINGGKTWQNLLNQAGVVLDFLGPDVLSDVADGDVAIDAAFKRAEEIRNSEEADKLAEKARKKAEAEQAKAEAARNEQIISDLTAARAAKYLGLIEDGTFAPPEAWAAYQEATRKQREEAAAIERGIKDALTHISNAVQFLSTTDADLFVIDTLPHRDRYQTESRYLTAEHIDAAIDYLTTIRKAL